MWEQANVIPADAEIEAANPPKTVSSRRVVWLTFGVLFFMNLLDYTDRWILTGMLPEIRKDLVINNTQAGLLATYFLVSYALVSPLMGFAGDRFKRTRLLTIGIGIWSPGDPRERPGPKLRPARPRPRLARDRRGDEWRAHSHALDGSVPSREARGRALGVLSGDASRRSSGPDARRLD